VAWSEHFRVTYRRLLITTSQKKEGTKYRAPTRSDVEVWGTMVRLLSGIRDIVPLLVMKLRCG